MCNLTMADPSHSQAKSDLLFGRGSTENLGSRTARGGLYTMIAQFAGFVITMGSTAVLARLLTPMDFGIVAKVAAIVGVFGLLKDMGLSMATVQRDHITREQISTLFWINVLIGFILMVLIAASAPLISWFYDDSRTVAVTLIMAVNAFFGTLPLQQRALLNRNLRFGTLTIIGISNSLFAAMVTIYLAYIGWSYWALVMTGLVSNFTALFMLVIATRWFPGRPVRGSGVRSMLKFGGNLAASNVLGYVCANVDTIAVGRVFGDKEAGLYNKSWAFLHMPLQKINGPANAVVIPALSRCTHDPKRFADIYERCLKLLLVILVPSFLVLAVFAREIVLLVFGYEWLGMLPYYYAMLPAILSMATGPCLTWAPIAYGQSHRLLWLGFLNMVVVAMAMAFGLPHGAIAFVWMWSLPRPIIRVMAIRYANQGLPVGLKHVYIALAQPLLAALVACVPALIVKRQLHDAHFATTLASGVAIFLFCYVTVVALLPLRQEMIETVRFLRR